MANDRDSKTMGKEVKESEDTENGSIDVDIKKLVQGDSILQLIGNTPTVRLDRLSREAEGEVLIKLEGCNPSGSLKDRAALFMIYDAIRTGRLKQGMRVLDASSGNMASAIAMVASRMGYEACFVLGNTLTKEKEQYLRLFNAEIIRYDGNTWECSHQAARIANDKPDQYCFLDQFHNQANLLGHYYTTGPEVLRDVPDADVYMASLGSGGTVCGAGRFLKEINPDIKVIAVSAETGTRIPGLRNLDEEGFVPPLADMDMFDDIIRVNEANAMQTVRRVLETESLLLGHQGGAVVWAALQAVRKPGNKKVVAVMGDSSWKNMDILLKKLS